MMGTNDRRYTVESRAAVGRTERIAPRRPLKLQICLSVDERRRLYELARAAGHDSLSAYLRACALRPAVSASAEGAQRG